MNNPYARYTETLKEFCDNHPSFLTDTIVLTNPEHSQKLIEMIKSHFDVYEIGAETEDLFMLNFKDTFIEWKDYYEELINAYYKEYDYALNNRKRNIKETRFVDNTETNSEEVNNEFHKNIELPNKMITDGEDKYVNNSYKNNDNKNVKGGLLRNTTTEDSNTTYYDDEIIDLKNKYIKQLRNLFLEFALKFRENFIIIY